MNDCGISKLDLKRRNRMQIPSTYTTLDDEEAVKKMNLLLENLEEDDDVQNVFHNWSMPEED